MDQHRNNYMEATRLLHGACNKLCLMLHGELLGLREGYDAVLRPGSGHELLLAAIARHAKEMDDYWRTVRSITEEAGGETVELKIGYMDCDQFPGAADEQFSSRRK